MSNKILIAKGEFKGNLKSGKQSYIINYMPREFINGSWLNDKIEIAIITPSEKDSNETVYRSLRFDEPSKLHLFIIDCIRAEAYFRKVKGELDTSFKVGFYSCDFNKKILKVFKDVLSEGF